MYGSKRSFQYGSTNTNAFKTRLEKKLNYSEAGVLRKQRAVKQAQMLPAFSKPNTWSQQLRCTAEQLGQWGAGGAGLSSIILYCLPIYRFFPLLHDSHTGAGISQQNCRNLYRSGCGHCEMLYWLFHLFSVLR